MPWLYRRQDPMPVDRRTTPLWLATTQAAKYLGISIRTLRHWRASEYWIAGTHYRRKGPNPHSEMIFNVYACEAAITEFTVQTTSASCSS